jgi:hypothetical protein
MASTFKRPIAVAYHRLSTRAEFSATLRKIEEDFRTTGRLPVLQIETHGLYADLDGRRACARKGSRLPTTLTPARPIAREQHT